MAAQIVNQGISLPPRAIAVVGRDDFRSTGWERNVSVAVIGIASSPSAKFHVNTIKSGSRTDRLAKKRTGETYCTEHGERVLRVESAQLARTMRVTLRNRLFEVWTRDPRPSGMLTPNPKNSAERACAGA